MTANEIRFDRGPDRAPDLDAYDVTVRYYEAGKPGRIVVGRVSGPTVTGASRPADELWFYAAKVAAGVLHDDLESGAETNVPVAVTNGDIRAASLHTPAQALEPEVTVLRSWES